MLKSFLRNEEGERRFWSHGRKHGKNHGARWWYWPGNSLHIEWVWFKRAFGLTVEFDDQLADHAVQVMIAIPWLFTFYVSITNCRWLIRLLGLQWKRDVSKWGDCRRELGFRIFDHTLWLYPWVDTMSGSNWVCISPIDIIFGRQKYSETDRREFTTKIDMPEGKYPAAIQLYKAQWKRPRWPKISERTGCDVDVEGGIPIPYDDAIFSIGSRAETLPEAKLAMRDAVMRHRFKEGCEPDWIPSAGWPNHCELKQSRD